MITEPAFQLFSETLLRGVRPDEALAIELSAEASQFIRLNRARVRQIGAVEDASVTLTLYLADSAGKGHRSHRRGFTLTGDAEADLARGREALQALRSEIAGLPLDPYAQLPENKGSSRRTARGELLSPEHAVEALLPPAQGVDLAGIYASGAIIRANANSAGQFHWFYADSYSLDYSLYTQSERALKGIFAGREWSQGEYQAELSRARGKLPALERPARKIPRGSYRTYLAPAAVADLIGMFSWGCVGEAAIRQGDSPLRLCRDGSRSFSRLFSLSEDFRSGDVPRFNELGETAPETIPLIDKGRLVGTLVSSRSSKEYSVPSNAANQGESLRAPVVATGSLREEDILKRLGTGLYLSNLHYLNWSDQPGGRITGMTRYACFWVENGEIVAPIESLRWDDTIFSLFGSALEDFTQTAALIPATGSYFFRSLGAERVPGMLLGKMEFTL